MFEVSMVELIRSQSDAEGFVCLLSPDFQCHHILVFRQGFSIVLRGTGRLCEDIGVVLYVRKMPMSYKRVASPIVDAHADGAHRLLCQLSRTYNDGRSSSHGTIGTNFKCRHCLRFSPDDLLD